MPDAKKVTTKSGLTFDAWIEGPDGGALVLLLHGYPQSRHSWRHQVPALAAAGFRALAPDQRGYSPGARPDPADLANYAFERIVGDAADLADAVAGEGCRFHLVGHDWGGPIAGGVADRHAARVASLTILSRPHPQAFVAALQNPDSGQQHRSRHHKAFLDAGTADLLLADDARRLRTLLAENGVPPEGIDAYVSVLGTGPAMEAALAWYRSNKELRNAVGTITVPTLYAWGDADHSVSRMAAEGTGAFVSGGYTFEVLPGAGHFSSDQMPERVTELLLGHVRAHPV